LKAQARELARKAKIMEKAAGIMPIAKDKARKLQAGADKTLAQAEDLTLKARLEDLHVWEMKKVKESKKGSKTYTYWMATWREDGKTRNVHLGSARKKDAETALQKARKMKAAAIHVN